MSKVAPRFETPAWLSSMGVGPLQTRRDGDALFLKVGEAVYRHDPATGTMRASTIGEWNASPSPIGDCDRPVATTKLAIESDTNRLVDARGKHVKTAGQTALAIAVSPDGVRAAVLSAAGSRARSLMPFLGSGGADGQHYHQLFSLAGDIVPVGDAVLLPFGGAKENLRVCWSSDGKDLLYTDIIYSKLSIARASST